MSDYENETITVCGPRWAWDTIWESLQSDMQSTSIDPEVCQQITRARDAVIEASEQAH